MCAIEGEKHKISHRYFLQDAKTLPKSMFRKVVHRPISDGIVPVKRFIPIEEKKSNL